MTLELDLEKSLVRVADRWFPAVGLVCPCHRERERCVETGMEHDRTHRLGSTRTFVSSLGFVMTPDVFVPMENGLAMQVMDREDGDGLGLLLLDPWHCTCDEVPDDSGWIPQFVELPSGHWEWTRCEPAWVVEHLLRVAARPAPARDLSGPSCRLITLGELVELEAT